MLKSSTLLAFSFVTIGSCFAACSSSRADSSGGGGAAQAGEPGAGADSVAGTAAAGSSSGGADATGANGGGADAAGANGGGTDAAGASGGSTDSAGSPSAGTPSGGSSSGGGGTGGSGPLPAGTSSCQYTVTGGATETSPDSPSVCSTSKLTTGYAGGFTATIGGGFQDAAGNIVALACTLDSPTAPAAGDTWTLSTAAGSQGNCQLNIVTTAPPAATIWAASANDAKLIGAATVKFKSATLTHGMYKPADVYYFFDATLEATIPGQSAGAADVQVSGRFQLQTLPLGS